MKSAMLLACLMAVGCEASAEDVVSVEDLSYDATFETGSLTMPGHSLTITGLEDGVWRVDGDLEIVIDQDRKTVTLRSTDTAWECWYDSAPEQEGK